MTKRNPAYTAAFLFVAETNCRFEGSYVGGGRRGGDISLLISVWSSFNRLLDDDGADLR